MRSSTRDGLAYLVATALIAAVVSALVVRFMAPAPRILQIAMPAPMAAALQTGDEPDPAKKPQAEFEGYLEVWDAHSRPERVNWKWGYRKLK